MPDNNSTILNSMMCYNYYELQQFLFYTFLMNFFLHSLAAILIFQLGYQRCKNTFKFVGICNGNYQFFLNFQRIFLQKAFATKISATFQIRRYRFLSTKNRIILSILLSLDFLDGFFDNLMKIQFSKYNKQREKLRRRRFCGTLEDNPLYTLTYFNHKDL